MQMYPDIAFFEEIKPEDDDADIRVTTSLFYLFNFTFTEKYEEMYFYVQRGNRGCDRYPRGSMPRFPVCGCGWACVC